MAQVVVSYVDENGSPQTYTKSTASADEANAFAASAVRDGFQALSVAAGNKWYPAEAVKVASVTG